MQRRLVHGGTVFGLIALGYVLGLLQMNVTATSRAQDPPKTQEPAKGPSEEATTQIRTANQNLTAAMQALQQEGRYVPAIRGVNSFAVLVGGIDVLGDLEANRGVDPETFAGLYAGLATDEVAPKLGRDAEGRLTYENKVVRMYPISRLREMFANRARIAGETTESAAERELAK